MFIFCISDCRVTTQKFCDPKRSRSVLRLMAVKAAAAEHKKPGDREVARMVRELFRARFAHSARIC